MFPFIAFSLLAAGAVPKDDPQATRSVEREMVPIGSWQFVRVVQDGTELAGGFQDWRLTFAECGDWSVNAQVGAITYQAGSNWKDVIKPERSALDLFLSKGLYTLKRDKLVICLGKERPTRFTAPKGSGRHLWVLQRLK